MQNAKLAAQQSLGPMSVHYSCAGQAVQSKDTNVSGSKWKVVADKMGEGKGRLAALLLNMNQNDKGAAVSVLPALV